MASRPEMNDMVKTSPTTTKDKDGGTGVPSGFILKLYQMVNGASDDIISVRKMIWQLTLHEVVAQYFCSFVSTEGSFDTLSSLR
jgi:hypothetical protein